MAKKKNSKEENSRLFGVVNDVLSFALFHSKIFFALKDQKSGGCVY